MNMKNVALCPLILLLSFTAFGQSPIIPAPVSNVSLPPELARVLKGYETAWKNKDAAALAALFAEDGFVLAAGHPMVRGRGEVERFYHDAGGNLSLRPVAFAIDGNLGYIIGGFSDRPGVPDRGKFTLTLRRDSSGRWLIVSDMDNGNVVPKPHAE